MMEKEGLEATYVPSENIVAREIEGELIIVPLYSGIGDLEDELYSLNETGKAIWSMLDRKNTLKDVVAKISAEFKARPGEIEKDVIGLMEELKKRKMVNEVPVG